MEKEKTYDTEKRDILIFDWRIERVLDYLEDNEFTHKPHRAYKHGCTNWVFANLNRRTYTRGVGGIQTGRPLKNHAVTFEDFNYLLDVYNEYGEGKILDEIVENVFAKYEGKEIFTFHSEKFDLEKPQAIEPLLKNKHHREVIKDDD